MKIWAFLLATLMTGPLPFAAGPVARQPILESIEWTDIWVTGANRTDRPHVLLVGDSIVRGYYEVVEKELGDRVYCARYTTSAFLTNPDYLDMLRILLRRYHFDVIHMNNGLHGYDYSEKAYTAGFPELYGVFRDLAPEAKLIWATTTPVRCKGELSRLDPAWAIKVQKRNEIAVLFWQEHGVLVDDLYGAVVNHPEYSREDGVHFNADGYSVLGKQVARAIRAALE